MGRAFGFGASFVAVVGGSVAVVQWLHSQYLSLGLTAAVSFGIAILLIAIRDALEPRPGNPFDAFLDKPVFRWAAGYQTIAIVGGSMAALDALGVNHDLLILVVSSICIAGTAAPLAWDLYDRDRATRKECPDCGEKVKVHARVCRYCGYRWPTRRGSRA